MKQPNFGITIMALIFTCFSMTSNGMETNECNRRVLSELFNGKKIDVTVLDNVRSRGGRIKRSYAFGSSDDLVIAIDDNAHTYDNIFDARHDGHHSAPGRVKMGTDLVEFGNYLKLEGISEQKKVKLYEHLKTLSGKDLEQTSCIRSTCEIIQEATGIKVKGRLPHIPSRILNKIIKKGFVDENGNPVKYNIYRVQGKTMQETYDILRTREANYVKKKKSAVKNIIKSKIKNITVKSISYIIVRGAVTGVILETPGSSLQHTNTTLPN